MLGHLAHVNSKLIVALLKTYSFCYFWILGPTKPGRVLAEQDMIELLDYGFFEPLEQSALKRKVTFTGIKGSPPKIPCAAVAEGDLFLDIKPLGRKSERPNKKISSPCQSDQVSSVKARSSAVKRNATE